MSKTPYPCPVFSCVPKKICVQVCDKTDSVKIWATFEKNGTNDGQTNFYKLELRVRIWYTNWLKKILINRHCNKHSLRHTGCPWTEQKSFLLQRGLLPAQNTFATKQESSLMHSFYLTQQKIGFNSVNVCTCCY